MTKYGQEGFTDVLRMEMRKFGIKVITVEPGNFSASTAMLNKSKVRLKNSENVKMCTVSAAMLNTFSIKTQKFHVNSNKTWLQLNLKK